MPSIQELYSFLTQHWTISCAIVFTLILLLKEETGARVFAKHILTPDEANTLIQEQQALLLDIRDKNAHFQERPEKAQWVRHDELSKTPEKVIKPDQLYILFCTDGVKSTEIAQFLRQKHGFKLSSIEGGYHQWKLQKKPLNDLKATTSTYQKPKPKGDKYEQPTSA
ncbi:MAG: rhodanese-like domain-containing protein [Pseudomonadota bacterium]|nr:rhodanese-like domain-containing protein [Pseudomonadota bacterium]